jgi:Xaa-Pro aminopeptidase
MTGPRLLSLAIAATIVASCRAIAEDAPATRSQGRREAPVEGPASRVEPREAAPRSVPPAPPDDHRARREALARTVGEGIVLLRGAPEPDLTEFRQERNFLYFTGCEIPGAALLLDVESAGPEGDVDFRETLFLPAKDEALERWNGPRLTPGEEAEKATGIRTTRASADLDSVLSSRLARRPAFVTEYAHGALGRPLSAELLFLRDVQDRFPGLDVRPIGPSAERLRAVKSAAEVALLEEAIRITDEAHLEAMRVLEPGRGEFELEAAIEGTFRRLGAERPAFPSIVGSGPNSCVLHYQANDRTMEDGDLVVVDVGAEYRNYAADVTRTYPVSGRFTPEQREIVEAVREAQRVAIEAIRPGATLAEVHEKARGVLRDRGELDRHFPHGTSHHIGLEVHDPAGERGRRLEPGMVVTVEPGVYIPEKNLGVRIEDDVLVTDDGHRVLSTGSPSDPDSIERFLASRRPAAARSR